MHDVSHSFFSTTPQNTPDTMFVPCLCLGIHSNVAPKPYCNYTHFWLSQRINTQQRGSKAVLQLHTFLAGSKNIQQRGPKAVHWKSDTFARERADRHTCEQSNKATRNPHKKPFQKQQKCMKSDTLLSHPHLEPQLKPRLSIPVPMNAQQRGSKAVSKLNAFLAVPEKQ